MSLDFYVFVDRNCLPSADAWQTAIRVAELDLEFKSGFDPLKSRGFVPCKLGTSATGFEYLLSPKEDVLPACPDLSPVVTRFNSVASFTFGGNPAAQVSAAIASATLTNSCEGLMYDPQNKLRFDGAKALNYARLMRKNQ